MRHISKKWVPLGKISNTRKNDTWILENKGETVKKGHTWKNGSHMEKWVTPGKTGQTWKKDSHLEKWVTLRKVGQT